MTRKNDTDMPSTGAPRAGTSSHAHPHAQTDNSFGTHRADTLSDPTSGASRREAHLLSAPRASLPPVSGRAVRFQNASWVWHPRLAWATSALVVASLTLGVIALCLGAVQVPLSEVIPAMFGRSAEGKFNLAVQGIRFPRVVAALFAGAALGVSGSVFQSISHNALGSPDVIGLTTGAATGAISQIILFDAGPFQVAVGALIGGLGASIVIYVLSLKGGVTGGYRLVLIGLGVGALLSSLNSVMIVRGDVDLAFSANVWISGSVDSVKWPQAVPVAVVAVVVIPLVAACARRATLLEMGDDIAAQLGVHPEWTRRILIVLSVILASVATSAIGPIAFIALASPQLAKLVTGSRSLPVFSAAAMGATVMLLALVVTSALPLNLSLPIGQVTGLIGGVYLAWLLTRTKQV